MTNEQREQLRLSLLRFLEGNLTRFGLPTAVLLQMARSEGRTELQKGQVEGELEYLAEKGLAVEALKGVSPENRNWRITANGRDFVAAQMGS
jgi:hypothetical protein